MQNLIHKTLLKNRHTLLATIIIGYLLIIVIEGAITDREPQPYVFENPYVDLDLNTDPADRNNRDGQAAEDEEISLRRLFLDR